MEFHSGSSSVIANEIARIFPDLTDWDLELEPPAIAQLAFARPICNQLGCQVTVVALHSRASMHEFISESSLALRARR